MIVPLNEYDFLKRALVAHASKEAVVCGDPRLDVSLSSASESTAGQT